MSNNKFILRCLSIGIFASSIALTSCDQEYDWDKDISSEIEIGGGISLPIGQTEQLKLSRIIKIEDAITTENDAYALNKAGELDVDVASVEKIHLTGLSARPVIEDIFPNIPNQTVSKFECPLLYYSNIDSNESVPEEIEQLTDVEFSPINAVMTFTVSFDNNATLSKLTDVRFNNLTISFPKNFVFGANVEGLDYSTNIMTLNSQIPASGVLEINLPIIDIIDIPEIDKNTNTVNIKKTITFKGGLSGNANGTSYQEMSSMVLNTSFDIPEITINKVKGRFKPTIDINAEKISMGNLPDVLTDENTNININTIFTKIEISNPIGIPFYANLQLGAFDKSGRPINEKVNVQVYVPAATDYNTPKLTKFFITNNSSLNVPEGYELIVEKNLNKLVGKIPSQIEIKSDITVDTSKEHFILLGNRHNTRASYDVTMPFDFGENSKIKYTESFDGIQDDLSDIVDKITEMEVYADITNTIPLQLTINATPYDFSGNDMSNQVEITKNILIEAGNEQAPTSSKAIMIKELEKGSLKNLDRIEITIEGNTNQANTILKPEQYVTISLKAKLPKGFTVDFDDI